MKESTRVSEDDGGSRHAYQTTLKHMLKGLPLLLWPLRSPRVAGNSSGAEDSTDVLFNFRYSVRDRLKSGPLRHYYASGWGL